MSDDAMPDREGELDRRRFLRRAAVAGAAGAAAWVTPAIVTVRPASAATLTSPPPTPGGSGDSGGSVSSVSNQPLVADTEITRPDVRRIEITPGARFGERGPGAGSAEVLAQTVEAGTGHGGALAVTGADLDRVAAAGIGAIAAGAAVLQWTADPSCGRDRPRRTET